jgi:hypothetical protein
MQHAEAHERLVDLALEPRSLVALKTDQSPDGVELRDHIAGCATCTAELKAWHETHATVLEAFRDPSMHGSGASAEEQPIALPPGLRASVARIPADDRAGGPAPIAAAGGRPRIPRISRFGLGMRTWGALAAALVLAVAGSGAIALDQAHRADSARADAGELAVLVRSTQVILADPYHKSLALASTDGSSSGLVAWTENNAVVLATQLATPPAGQVYRCWVEQGGTRTAVGEMSFRDGVGYWWQHQSETAGSSIWSHGQFIVTLGPPDGPGGPAILSATLPG